mgnify:FL=1|tara:strand:- start:90 stop:527 length:438 start_codon:yes stop_codon:yes gene_type:complete
MATTTATLTVSSLDLQPGNTLSISASSTLMQAGLTTGLTQVEAGVIKLSNGVESRLGPLATEIRGSAHDIGSYLYLCNTATDATYYVEWGIHETVIGRLYAGDWMLIPWNASDDDAELELEAENGDQIIEYAWFNNDFAPPAAAS